MMTSLINRFFFLLTFFILSFHAFAGPLLTERIQSHRDLHSALVAIELLQLEVDLVKTQCLAEQQDSCRQQQQQQQSRVQQAPAANPGFRIKLKSAYMLVKDFKTSLDRAIELINARSVKKEWLKIWTGDLQTIGDAVTNSLAMMEVPGSIEIDSAAFEAGKGRLFETLEFVNKELTKYLTRYRESLDRERIEIDELISLARKDSPELFTQALEQQIRDLERQRAEAAEKLQPFRAELETIQQRVSAKGAELSQLDGKLAQKKRELDAALAQLSAEHERSKKELEAGLVSCRQSHTQQQQEIAARTEACKKEFQRVEQEIGGKKKGLQDDCQRLEQTLAQKKQEHQASCQRFERELTDRGKQFEAQAAQLERDFTSKNQAHQAQCQALDLEFERRKATLRDLASAMLEDKRVQPVEAVAEARIFRGGVPFTIQITLEDPATRNLIEGVLKDFANQMILALQPLNEEREVAPKHPELNEVAQAPQYDPVQSQSEIILKITAIKAGRWKWSKDKFALQAIVTSKVRRFMRELPLFDLIEGTFQIKDGFIKDEVRGILVAKVEALLNKELQFIGTHYPHFIEAQARAKALLERQP